MEQAANPETESIFNDEFFLKPKFLLLKKGIDHLEDLRLQGRVVNLLSYLQTGCSVHQSSEVLEAGSFIISRLLGITSIGSSARGSETAASVRQRCGLVGVGVAS